MAKDTLQETAVRRERAMLVSVDTGEFDAESSMEELFELTESAGAEPVCSVIQKLQVPEKATCVGSGMLQEIAQQCGLQEIDVLVFDRELSPTQIRNIENAAQVHVIDRTMVILDIFAARAATKEGKLQVELAQLRYMLPRLTGKGIALSRQGAGIGTRGPGETKLETDRRHISRRIQSLESQLEDVKRHRDLLRRRREKTGSPVAALVGYTNVGKSTLMNRLTQAGVLAENKLFATLDPTARSLKLPGGSEIILIDTVGLVRRLPHHLVEAFRSTLEQMTDADIILNICDVTSPEADVHLQVTRELLDQLKCGEKPIINVLNKCDLLEPGQLLLQPENSVRISAATGEGVEDLLRCIEEQLPEQNIRMSLMLPYEKSGLAAEVRRDGVVYEEEYLPQGLRMEALVSRRTFEKVWRYGAENGNEDE